MYITIALCSCNIHNQIDSAFLLATLYFTFSPFFITENILSFLDVITAHKGTILLQYYTPAGPAASAQTDRLRARARSLA